MRQEVIISDITVVGGGLAGVSAAVAAARLGRSVSLIQNRPVLGGNSSSEVRVWVCGATAHGTNRYARETGIMGELFLENQYCNIDGNPYIWDMVLLETVRAEPNIRLFLNTDVHEVEADGDTDNRVIRSVTGWMMGSEQRIRFESGMFLDCSGDGLVGFLAGAKHRIGREAREEYNEDWAPPVADDITLGSTMFFYTKDAGHQVKFIPPSFAKDITKTTIPMTRVIRSGDNGCAYWWIEWGGEMDTVLDNERIRDELWAVIYGLWDYIKNSGNFNADNMTLEWVGSIPGKREYRRFIGDYMLNQNDIVAQREFEDGVAFGGWSIDLHPPQGMYSTESGSKHLHADGVYHIPFRSLYSVNVNNLIMAGRNISASHVAFGTTRVMATCAVIGEAAGTGAALCAEKGVVPRELYQTHLRELQQTLLHQGASIIGLRNDDVTDLARSAKLKASSTLTQLVVEKPIETYPLASDTGLILPVDPELKGIALLVDAAENTTLELELWDTGRGENYVPHTKQLATLTPVAKGTGQYVSVNLHWKPATPQNAFLVVKANERLALHLSNEQQFGVLAFAKGQRPIVSPNLGDQQPSQPVVQWNMRPFNRKPICFRLLSPTQAYAAEKVIDGYHRPFAGPHLWSSDSLRKDSPEWLELNWPAPVNISTVHITFNDDVNEDLINLHHHRTPFETIPELVKDYLLQVDVDGEWITVAEGKNNRKRRVVHSLDQLVSSDRLRVVVEATNGCPRAEIFEIRVYE
ncbi:pyridine nucleotide-disulfide oxidoreductase [Paenibacillus odorifer]|uniref:Pyridine nucleotide-disulfide oxidoreductase n=1 Tax=Paenibacillus odorifer TaxID=189426 RepID=A0A1R0ZM45_9BACL|nr:FAD-dependent oxidoreductase [Paenibacillus odorifer]OME73329.1 pyridine nucleotide-disulfide oxidoreductase [Paenibacillus odorifer]